MFRADSLKTNRKGKTRKEEEEEEQSLNKTHRPMSLPEA